MRFILTFPSVHFFTKFVLDFHLYDYIKPDSATLPKASLMTSQKIIPRSNITQNIARIHQPIAWIAPQPNIQIIEDIKNTAPPTTLIQPPASSSFLDSLPLPVSSINTDIPNSMVPTTIPAISL